jgi:hypothetical protein
MHDLICRFFAGETMHRVARDATPLRKIVKRLSLMRGDAAGSRVRKRWVYRFVLTAERNVVPNHFVITAMTTTPRILASFLLPAESLTTFGTIAELLA